MSEEEKKAIEIVEFYLKNSAINSKDRNFFKNGGWETVDLEIPKAMQTIIKLFKNQQKEIKLEKEKRIMAEHNYDELSKITGNLTVELEGEKRKNIELEIIIGGYKNACDNVCETTQNMINNLYISKSKLKDLFEQSNAHPVKLYSDIKELLGE